MQSAAHRYEEDIKSDSPEFQFAEESISPALVKRLLNSSLPVFIFKSKNNWENNAGETSGRQGGVYILSVEYGVTSDDVENV